MKKIATSFAVLIAATGIAQAHAVLEVKEVQAGSSYKGIVSITHGCKASPTIQVSIDIPEGLIGVKPMPKPGWTITTQTGPYAREYASWHGNAREGVKRIVWSGGKLPDNFTDEFQFRGLVAKEIAAGPLYVPVIQTCETGVSNWIQIPGNNEGRSAALSEPAPSLMVLAANDAPAARSIMAGPLKIDGAWARATPNGATVAGGYLRITNTGATPDRLVSGTSNISDKFEVHEMSMDGGVMKMRALSDGIAIAPGATVELKPGGYHIMFTDLKQPVAEGSIIKAVLMFEKAGRVDVDLKAAPIGAPAPAGASGAKADMPAGGHDMHKH